MGFALIDFIMAYPWFSGLAFAIALVFVLWSIFGFTGYNPHE